MESWRKSLSQQWERWRKLRLRRNIKSLTSPSKHVFVKVTGMNTYSILHPGSFQACLLPVYFERSQWHVLGPNFRSFCLREDERKSESIWDSTQWRKFLACVLGSCRFLHVRISYQFSLNAYMLILK